MKLRFASSDLQLEGQYLTPAVPVGAAVICHPHPLYGGNMDNNVVLAIETGLSQAGFATLRFNFRGVGASDGGYENGVGEQADVRAAVSEVIRQSGLPRCTVAGYSFGAMMVVQVGAAIDAAERLILVAPPLSFGGVGPLAQCAKPKLFVAGDRDSYCGVAELERELAGVSEPKHQNILAGADHFFGGHDEELTAIVRDFVRCGA